MSVVSRVEAPSGEVTLMFTHVEGAAALWEKFGEGFQVALEAHNELMRRAISANSGYEVKTISDSFMAAFPEAILAANCAIEMQRLIETESFSGIGGMRVRIGLHTGRLTPQNGDYFGPAVNHAARIESSAHGGQIVLSEQTCNLIATRLSIDLKLQDTGLHRLKDLASPIRLFTLTRSDLPERGYPPLRTLDAFPHNFPGQATSFVGRESEIVELSDLLVKRKTRLVTIIGPGGTGKTRLAMQVGADCIDFFPDGVWMIDLVNTSNARDVPSAVAIALKIELSSADPRGQIVAHLREKRALLIFDNFEHVIEASRFLGGLIKECRNLVCLVTSQHLLQISGEHEYPLSPLELPPDDVTLVAGMRYAGLRLFVERAMTASPHFSLDESSLPAVTAICKRLEGLPLAIELTASLCRAMTPQQILPKLQDRFKLLASARRDLDPRQRSLRGALDWSYDLLNEDERKLFSELSVFAGGFSLEALEEVCPIPEALDYVFALRDKSLVRTLEQGNEIRYSMLESIREYARERQREFEEDVSADNEGEPREAIRSRHASYFLRLAQEHSPKLLNAGLELEAARKVIEIDLANMRVGMQFNIEQRNGAEIVNYGIELSRFLQIRSLYSECEEVLNVSEAAARDNGNKSSLALLLNRQIAQTMNRLFDSFKRVMI